MSNDNILCNLPEGLEEMCNPEFLETLGQGHVPEFSWYTPRFLPQPSKHKHANIEYGKATDNKQESTNVENDANNINKDASKLSEGYLHKEKTTSFEEMAEANSFMNSLRFFPPLMHVVLSDKLDGTFNEKNGSVLEQVAERRKALHLDWYNITPIEELWNGPPLPAKTPQARDFEKILLDDDDDNIDLDHPTQKLKIE